MDTAPFFADVARAPEGAQSLWLRAADGARIRSVHWRAGDRGTVLIFTGRTEYAEKYGPAAGEFARRGYSVATLDWRGQGLADRLIDDPLPGHVVDFDDYQKDVAAFAAHLQAQDLPRPWFLVGHSMGGCIGLRALHRGLAVRAVTFSAPMWGILMPRAAGRIVRILSELASRLGLGHRLTPTTTAGPYVLEAPFENNLLTRDAEMYEFMRTQLSAHPELSIAGPSVAWLRAALAETRALAAMDSPRLPCLTMLGTSERIVHIQAIHDRMGRWPGGRLEMIEGAEHEIMMERPEPRRRFFDQAAALFDAAGAGR